MGRVSLVTQFGLALLVVAIAGCSEWTPTGMTTAAAAPLKNGIKDGNKFYCFRGFKRCSSGIEQCIRPDKECDGVKDCADGSDEGKRCTKFDCAAAGRYKCPSGNICMNVSDAYGYGSWRYTYKDPYKYYLCDGVKDCADGSDEDARFCSSYNCVSNVPHVPVAMTMDWSDPSSRRIRCPDGKRGCVFESELCDGVAQCPGGSDEADSRCKKRGCSRTGPWSNHFQCESGRCFTKEKVCDGKRDCPGGDDEGKWCAKVDCPRDDFRKCLGGNNQTCVSTSSICDGLVHCPGGTDEKQCGTIECPNGGRRCPSNKQCITDYGDYCDGVKNCRDGSDEDPTFCRTFQCREDWQVKCKDGRQCISTWDLCDGFQHCRDASDEDPAFCRSRANCSSEYMVKCPGRVKTCISRGSLCDRSIDCLDGSDEDRKYCASEAAANLIAADGRVRCFNDKTNYTYGSYCDGYKDCPDGRDESSSFCKKYTCPVDKVKCYGSWCVYGQRCDGRRDCPDGSDEKGCGGRSRAAHTSLACVGPGRSINDCGGYPW